ncbi:MAG: DUF4433 domain-containing protein [Microbacteriaceae bacterium]|nr:DUF4433 domain-containing protein [Microbacteriaceae bacterium]
MDDECIHGFPVGLCDICFPRTPADPVRRAPRPVRSGGVPRARAESPGHTAAPFALATHRFFHVTHLRNLAAILDDGALRPDATPVVDVSSATTRELRRAADLADGRTVAAHVPFFAAPLATRWLELRDGAVGPHWSDAARAARATEFVLLGVPGSALGDAIVASDRDAGASATRFGIGPGDAAAVLRRARATDPDLADVELLSAEPVPISAIAAVSVASEPVRDTVRELFAVVDAAPRIAVYPPWFATA